MSRRRNRGFSLLEVQVGLLLMTLVVVGFTRLVGAQESMLRDLEDWCRDEPVFVVTPPADEHERVARMPAGLVERMERSDTVFSVSDFGIVDAVPVSDAQTWANELRITAVTRDLDPQLAQAVLEVRPIQGATDDDKADEDKDEDDDDKDKDKDKDKDDDDEDDEDDEDEDEDEDDDKGKKKS